MQLRDRIRIEVAVQRVGWWLDWKHMRGRRRREVMRELRGGLADAAAAGDLDAALERFGDTREMAAAYLEGETSGVRWRAGVLAALVAYGLVTWLVFAAMMGFVDGVEAVGSEPGEVYETGQSLVLGNNPLLAYEELDQGFAATFSLLTWPHLLALGLAFIAFARPWRALRGRAGTPPPVLTNEQQSQ